jgi:hypothetical protein
MPRVRRPPAGRAALRVRQFHAPSRIRGGMSLLFGAGQFRRAPGRLMCTAMTRVTTTDWTVEGRAAASRVFGLAVAAAGVPRPPAGVKGRCEPPLRCGSRSACGRPLTPASGVGRGRVWKRRRGVASVCPKRREDGDRPAGGVGWADSLGTASTWIIRAVAARRLPTYGEGSRP